VKLLEIDALGRRDRALMHAPRSQTCQIQIPAMPLEMAGLKRILFLSVHVCSSRRRLTIVQLKQASLEIITEYATAPIFALLEATAQPPLSKFCAQILKNPPRVWLEQQSTAPADQAQIINYALKTFFVGIQEQ
jgi:hypothetical protein